MEFSLLIPEKEKAKKCWERGARRGGAQRMLLTWWMDCWPHAHSSAVSVTVAVGPQGALAGEPLLQGPLIP